MLVRFWGTRGSLPVAPTADAIRRKIANALVAAGGRRFEDSAEAERFVETELSFAAGAHLRRRDLLRRAGSRRRVLFHLRHGQRPPAIRARFDAAQRGGAQEDLQFLPVPSALGPHHGLSLLRAGLRSQCDDPHPCRPPRRRAGAAPPAGGNLLPGAVRLAARQHRVRAADAGRSL